MARIRFDSGPREGDAVFLSKPKMIFGRGRTCDCVLPHLTVSREHFYIENNMGKYFVIDQGSNNGTYVNGARIASWIELKDGDVLRAGPFTMTVDLAMSKETEIVTRATSLDKQTEIVEVGDTGSTPLAAFSAHHQQLYPREYLDGIDYFNQERYFEAHEAWEEIWMRSEGETKLFYQMLIQAAVGLHHFEKGNFRGARGMHHNVVEKIPRLPDIFMSLDIADFAQQFRGFFADLMERNVEAVVASVIARPRIQLIADDANR